MRKVLVILIIISFGQACQSVSKSEAEQRGQRWFDESFTMCSGDYFAKYPDNKEEDRNKREKLLSLTALYVGEFGSPVNEGVFQFKNLVLVVKDKPVTETERLNGHEAKAIGTATYTQYRYHDGEKWSRWEDKPLTYSSPLMKLATDMFGGPNSPMSIGIEKNKGSWSVNFAHWAKVQCSELPTL